MSLFHEIANRLVWESEAEASLKSHSEDGCPEAPQCAASWAESVAGVDEQANLPIGVAQS